MYINKNGLRGGTTRIPHPLQYVGWLALDAMEQTKQHRGSSGVQGSFPAQWLTFSGLNGGENCSLLAVVILLGVITSVSCCKEKSACILGCFEVRKLCYKDGRLACYQREMLMSTSSGLR